VVIGEGIKDNAPGIFQRSEQPRHVVSRFARISHCIDPIDGTTNISKGAPNSISCYRDSKS